MGWKPQEQHITQYTIQHWQVENTEGKNIIQGYV